MLLRYFQGRNSQLSEEAGRGAAGPVISHSWLTVMTDFFFLAPKHLLLNQSSQSLLLIHTTDYQKTKLCEQRLSQSFTQETQSYCEINRSTQLRGSGRLLGNYCCTHTLRYFRVTSHFEQGLAHRLFVYNSWLITHLLWFAYFQVFFE